MKVVLLGNYYSEIAANEGAAICVDKMSEEWNEGRNLEAALASGHLSVIEHLPLTFLVEGISRACSHQLVRHKQICVA